jgi:predicted transposase/invertase (TIGR01784 family)
VEVAGLAAASLVRVVLEADGEEANIGKVINVIPQFVIDDPTNRGCRVDIIIETDANDRIIAEVQLNTDANIMQRNLLASSHIFASNSSKGETIKEMASNMPRVITINILNYVIRKDNNDILQPFKILYTRPPMVTAIPQFSGYNIQLPRLAEMKPDFTNGLYCWLYTLYTAHKEGKTVQEVIAKTPQLQAYAEEDKGYYQFCDQYKRIAADPKTRNDYFWWINSQMRKEGELEGARMEGREIGLEEGREEGRIEERIKHVNRMTKAGMDDASIAELLDFPILDINKYR